MPTTQSPDPRWDQGKIDYEFTRGAVILDALSRACPVMIHSDALLDRAAQALPAARRAESP